MREPRTSGPLAGLRVVELAGIGPGPFAAILLADMGADVIRVERPEAGRSGKGQVVDAAIVDGTASLTTLMHAMLGTGLWRDERGVNMLDTGMPWYDVYETSDLAARGTFVEVDGVSQPAPAPRFSRTPSAVQRPPSAPGADTRAALRDWGVPEVDALIDSGVAVQS